jgi:hypothetical protein
MAEAWRWRQTRNRRRDLGRGAGWRAWAAPVQAPYKPTRCFASWFMAGPDARHWVTRAWRSGMERRRDTKMTSDTAIEVCGVGIAVGVHAVRRHHR